MIEIVPTTAEILRTWYGKTPPRSSKGIAAVRGDQVLGVAGVYLDGEKRVVFLAMSEELKKHRRVIVKAGRMLMRTLKAPVFAVCDENIEKAREFLEHWGFRHLTQGIYVWTE